MINSNYRNKLVAFVKQKMSRVPLDIFFVLFFIGFIADVFLIKPQQSYTDWSSDARLFLLLLLWLIIWRTSGFTSITTIALTLLFLTIFSFLFIFFRDHYSVERIASWIYVYLATGVIQQLLESRKKT